MSKDKAASKKANSNDASWNLIFKQLQEDKTEFSLNLQLEPMVSIPNDGFQTEWPVDSQRFQDLLISMYYEITGEILKTSERDFMMAQFREECRKGGRSLSEQEATETDEDVIVQAILFLVNSSDKTSGHSAFEDRTVVLLQKLRGFQTDGSIPCRQEIPLFTNIFSRKLTRLVPVLRGYGVKVDLSHEEDGSHCKLTQLDDFKFEPNSGEIQPTADGKDLKPSGQPSVGRPFTGSQIQNSDGTDGEMRYEGADDKSSLKPPQTNDPASQATTPIAPAKKGGAK